MDEQLNTRARAAEFKQRAGCERQTRLRPKVLSEQGRGSQYRCLLSEAFIPLTPAGPSQPMLQTTPAALAPELLIFGERILCWEG